MPSQRLGRQPDLFDTQPDLLDRLSGRDAFEPPPEDFIQPIREELEATLARVQAATALPWRDRTRAMLAEMRFDSIATWLPATEATRLRRDFRAAVTALYDRLNAEAGYDT